MHLQMHGFRYSDDRSEVCSYSATVTIPERLYARYTAHEYKQSLCKRYAQVHVENLKIYEENKIYCRKFSSLGKLF